MPTIIEAAQSFLADHTLLAVPAHKVDSLHRVMKSMANKAAKLKVEAPVAFPLHNDTIVMPKEQTYYVDGEWTYDSVKVDCVVFAVHGIIPRLTGNFSLLAALDFIPGTDTTPGAAVVRMVPGVDESLIPAKSYAEASSHCDHCNKLRKRKGAYLVRDNETGRTLQVGSTCLDTFVGSNSLSQVTFTFSCLDMITDAAGEWDDEIRSGRGFYRTDVFLGAVLLDMDDRGYISNKTGELSTVAMAIRTYEAFRNTLVSAESQKLLARAQQLRADAIAALEASDHLSVYEHSLLTLLRCDLILPKHTGFVASTGRMMEVRAGRSTVKDRPATAARTYVGTVGQKCVFTLTYTRTNSFESAYGTTHVHTFHDADGNVIVWKTGSGLWNEQAHKWFDVGTVFTCKASVKSHSEYRDTKQTVITRANLVPVQKD